MKLKPGAIVEAHSSHKNLTGTWRNFRPIFQQKLCTGCTLCVINCPEGCVFKVAERRFTCKLDYCKGCGICAEECPVGDIKMVVEEK